MKRNYRLIQLFDSPPFEGEEYSTMAIIEVHYNEKGDIQSWSLPIQLEEHNLAHLQHTVSEVSKAFMKPILHGTYLEKGKGTHFVIPLTEKENSHR